MVCDACAEQRHDECPGGTWCDCQHRPPTWARTSAAEPATGRPGE